MFLPRRLGDRWLGAIADELESHRWLGPIADEPESQHTKLSGE